MPIPLTTTGTGVVFAVRVIPRAGRTEIAGVRGDALLVRLAAAPVDGAANEALIAYLSTVFSRPKRDITLVSGQAARDKRISIGGVTEAEISSRLDALVAPRNS